MTSSTRIVVVSVMVCVCSAGVFAQSNCVETAKVVRPQLSAEAQRDLETKLKEARVLFENWYLYNGKRAEAEKAFRQVTAGNQWSSFGYIAAEAELQNRAR